MSALFHNRHPKQHDAHIQFIGARRRCLFADSYGLGFQHTGFVSPESRTHQRLNLPVATQNSEMEETTGHRFPVWGLCLNLSPPKNK